MIYGNGKYCILNRRETPFQIIPPTDEKCSLNRIQQFKEEFALVMLQWLILGTE